MQKYSPATIADVFPVSGLVYYSGGYVIKRKSKLQGQSPRGDRKEIKCLGNTSLSKLVLAVQSSCVSFRSMITLTYPAEFPSRVKIYKMHLRQILTWLARKFGRTSLFWFMEFQDRGAPHFHIVTEIPVSDARRKMLATKWVEVIGCEDFEYCRMCDRKMFHVKQSAYDVAVHPGTWQELRSVDGAKRYVTKYATKLRQKERPWFMTGTGRYWGMTSDLVPRPIVVVPETEKDLREWLKSLGHPAYEWAYLPKILFKNFTLDKGGI